MKPPSAPLNMHRLLHAPTRLLCLGALALILGACASGPSYSDAKSSFPPAGPGLGRIFVYRPYNYVGSAASRVIALNGELVGQCAAGGFFYVDRPPGTYRMDDIATFAGMSQEEAHQTFALRAGQVLYVRVKVGFALGFELVPKEQAVGEIASVAYSGAFGPEDFQSRLKLAKEAMEDFELYEQTSGMTFGPAASAPGPAVQAAATVESAPAPTQRSTFAAAEPSAPATGPAPSSTSVASARTEDRPPDPGPAAQTSEEADAMLTRNLLPAPGGLYSAESEYNFNVLDYVT